MVSCNLGRLSALESAVDAQHSSATGKLQALDVRKAELVRPHSVCCLLSSAPSVFGGLVRHVC